MELPRVYLKPGRARSLRNRHPWVFSGALASTGGAESGALVQVCEEDGTVVGSGYFNAQTSIAVRMLTFDQRDPMQALEESLRRAISLRARLARPDTNSYRLINSESDEIPGLIVDQYNDVLVLQISTLGIERQRATICAELLRALSPRAVVDRSLLPAREEEGLPISEGLVHGELVNEVEILERGMKFIVSLTTGQKTGFFLDQREMRALVEEHASGRDLLNCFSFSGAFSMMALRGGAAHVTSVDSSESALTLADRNLALNGFAPERHASKRHDVFEYLRAPERNFDFIILDPPAFAKKKPHLSQALKGYQEINRLALKRLPPGGLLLTCSCSYYVTREAFEEMIFHAAREAGKNVKILQRHRLAADHPISVYHPESDYLKSLLLVVY